MCIYLLVFVVKENEQIRVAVISGQRPDIGDITGRDKLVKLDWISRCWHQRPEERPTFAGIYCTN